MAEKTVVQRVDYWAGHLVDLKVAEKVDDLAHYLAEWKEWKLASIEVAY